MSRTALLLVAVFLPASGDAVGDDARLSKASVTFLRQQCGDCHGGGGDEGGFTVESLSGNLGEDDVDRWVRVIDRVRDGEMPPADHAVLAGDVRREFLSTTGESIVAHQRAEFAEFGRVRGRKLTGRQIERTLHDLLGIDIPLASRLPEEPKSDGFTTVARGQTMSYFDLQNHLNLVDAALNEAFRRVLAAHSSGKHKETWTREFTAKELSRKNPKSRNREPEFFKDRAVVWSHGLVFYGQVRELRAPEDGWYRVTFDVSSLKAPDRGVWCTVRTGACRSSDPAMTDVAVFLATPEKQTVTVEAFLPKGHMFEIRPNDGRVKQARTPGGQVGAGECQPQDVPGIGLHRATLQRFHKGPGDAFIHETLLGDDIRVVWDKRARQFAAVAPRPEQAVGILMRKFAARAFRRPVANSDLREYLTAAKSQLADGRPLPEVLRDGYRSILCSPRFVYLVEAPGRLDDHALASRLSYFLWNSMPDETLRDLADEGRLSDREVLAAQVERMLSDGRTATFAADFAREWLELSEIDFTQPSRRLHPTYDPVLQIAIVEETRAFLTRMIEDDLPVSTVIDSDFALLNERLADHYGVDGVSAGELVPVSLPADSPRGGLLTQAAVLKVTANGTATSPVLRGVWVSERLLGIHVPPPPTNVPAVEPDVRGATTIREQLAKHRSDEACASCHTKVDPAGFALENFDAAGQWRTKYPRGNNREKGRPIDASDRTPDGRFADVVGFQKIVAAHPDRLARNLAEHLLTYGTGAPPTFADRDAVEGIVGKAAGDDYGVRSIIAAVVQSEPFRTK